MRSIRKILKEYYIKQIIACVLSFWLLLGPSIVQANVDPSANALPNGVISSSGIAPLDYSSGRLDVTQTAGEAIINWTNFDIGSGATVEFSQPSVTAAILNRVHDGNPTGIMGNMLANGRVFVVNPAGIIFGAGARVNVAQLVASSLSITNDDFINGRYEFAGGNGAVFNHVR